MVIISIDLKRGEYIVQSIKRKFGSVDVKKLLAQELGLVMIVALVVTTISFSVLVKQVPPPQPVGLVNSHEQLSIDDGFAVFIGKNTHIPSDVSTNIADATNPSHPSYKKLKIAVDDRGVSITDVGIIDRPIINIGPQGTLYIRSRIVLRANQLTVHGEIDASGQMHALLPSDSNNPFAVGSFNVSNPDNLGYGGSGGGWALDVSSGGSGGDNGQHFLAANKKGEGVGPFYDLSMQSYFRDHHNNLLKGGRGASGSTSLGTASGGGGGDGVGGGGAALKGNSGENPIDGGGGGYGLALSAPTMDLQDSVIRANGASGSLRTASSFMSGAGGGGVIVVKTSEASAAKLRPKVLQAEPGRTLASGAGVNIVSQATAGTIYFPQLFVDQRFEALDAKHWQGTATTDSIITNLTNGGEIVIPDNKKLYIGKQLALPNSLGAGEDAIVISEPGVSIPSNPQHSLKRIVLGKGAKLIVRTRVALRAERVILGDGATIDADGQEGWLKAGSIYNSEAAGSVASPKFGFGGSGGAMANGYNNGASGGASLSAVEEGYGIGAGVQSISEGVSNYFKDAGGNSLLGGSGATGYAPSGTGNGGSAGAGVGGGGGAVYINSTQLSDGGGGGYGLYIEALQLAVSGKGSINAQGATPVLANSQGSSFGGGGGGGVIKLQTYSVLFDTAATASSLSYSVAGGRSISNGEGGITNQAQAGSFYAYPENDTQKPQLTASTLLNSGFKVKPGSEVEYIYNFGGNNIPSFFSYFAKIQFNATVIDPNSIGNELGAPTDLADSSITFNVALGGESSTVSFLVFATTRDTDFSIANFCEQSSVLKNQVYMGGDGSWQDAILKNEYLPNLAFICQTVRGNIYSGADLNIGSKLQVSPSSVITSSGTITYNGTSALQLENTQIPWDNQGFVRRVISTMRQNARYSNGLRSSNIWYLRATDQINQSMPNNPNRDGMWGHTYYSPDNANPYRIMISGNDYLYHGRGVIVANDHRRLNGDGTDFAHSGGAVINASLLRASGTNNDELAIIVPKGYILIDPPPTKSTVRIQAALFAPQGVVVVQVKPNQTVIIEGMLVADQVVINNPNQDGSIMLRQNGNLSRKPLPLFSDIARFMLGESLP